MTRNSPFSNCNRNQNSPVIGSSYQNQGNEKYQKYQRFAKYLENKGYSVRFVVRETEPDIRWLG